MASVYDKSFNKKLEGNIPAVAYERSGNRRQDLRKVATETIGAIPAILEALERAGKSPRYSCLYTDDEEGEICPHLNSDSPYFPDHTTEIKVVRDDTLDAADNLSHSLGLPSSLATAPVCILNLANQSVIGGDYWNGSRAQEEEICRRTTLVNSLHPHFYPMEDYELIYSPSVYIIRENGSRAGYKFMWTETPETLLEISVITLAAECRPKLNSAGDDSLYAESRELMEDKMRLALRAAANNHHPRLVLGAFGCRAFGHPASAVAELWRDVLSEEEFCGWFETVVFAVYDTNPPYENYTAFKEVFDAGVKISEYEENTRE
ncbi:hypothetical protein N7532_008149 [Penicillium argentinense]|uniref:Microbial-type PARG catalytic domain-containing protein n=1 Tax=Penicillium argentinense TaxID=1131581 RepID=A0A9W9EX53_9EURO|nr:uncharacterized protein N7532_008149 [Penicillium argentinense]KAJ5089465.1 hypothetical protein N7532_008149 [Penicillium argentinense]